MKFNRKRKANKLDAKEKNFLREFGTLHPINDDKKGSEKNPRSKIINELDDVESEEEQINSKKSRINDDKNYNEEEEDVLLPYQKLLSEIVVEEGNLEKDVKDKNKANDEKKFKKPKKKVKKQPIQEKNENKSDSDENNIEIGDDTLYSKEVLCKDNLENEESLKIDPFHNHFEIEIDKKVTDKIDNQEYENEILEWSSLGNMQLFYSQQKPNLNSNFDIKNSFIKQRIQERLNDALDEILPQNESKLSDKQAEMLKILTNYFDFYNPNVDLVHEDKCNKFVYTLHALNHILKTRSRVIAHNDKIKQHKGFHNVLRDYRDQGLTRPKVLILVPFKKHAFTIVNIIIKLLMRKNEEYITNKKRFLDEFGSEGYEQEKDEEHKDLLNNSKGEEFSELFSGNIDDHFRIGLSVSKRTLKLYTEFYSSDIIIASPLGLRTIIGNDDDKKRDTDFLSSLEIVIIDNADVLMMQNWDHVQTILNNLHILPKESHDTDFSRVRSWFLDGLAKYYCQKIVFSSVRSPLINSIFNKLCLNFSGKIQIKQVPQIGAICNIGFQLGQVFHRINCDSPIDLPNARFDFFINKLLPQFKDEMKSHTLIFIPSYFDFVKVRNYFKKTDIKSTSISEYSDKKQIERSRYSFYHGRVHFMLITERFHFYKRYRIRGIDNLIFYELPEYPKYYSDFCNFLQDPKRIQNEGQSSFSSTIIYSKYDAHKLACVVGYERATHMINSDKSVHMFMTESF